MQNNLDTHALLPCDKNKRPQYELKNPCQCDLV